MAVPIDIEPGDERADLTSHDAFVPGVPWATFERLRDDDPVSWWDEADGRGFWSLVRHDDVLSASRATDVFSSAAGIRLEDMDPEECEARRTLMETDPPVHTRYRRTVGRAFTPRAVADHEAAVRDIARRAIDALAGETRLDFTDDLARVLPMRMLGRLLGLPDEDGDWLVRTGDALIGNSDPDFTDHVVDLVDTSAYRLLPFRSPVAVELGRYGAAAFDARRAAPGDDLLSSLLAPTADGSRLDDAELGNFFTLLVAAGNDTTRYSLSSAMLALAERPELFAQVAALAAGGLPDAVVEEMLRWGSATMHFRRTATRDVELRGRSIHAGDKVVLWFVAANRDPLAFADPYRFDPSRSPNDHVAFGLRSPHLCLGAHLARLEIKVLFEELLPRLSGVSLAGKTERLRSNFINGIKHLPLEMTWR